jgi:hypothetical protein
MPDKDYEITLPSGVRIVVSIKMVGGRVVSFVVRLIARRGEEEYDAARYDTAHGKAHLDLLDRSGRVKEKRWLDLDDFETALMHAIEDFKLNHEEYLGAVQKG